MVKAYKIISVGETQNGVVIKKEHIIYCSDKNYAIQTVKDEYENLWSINVTFLLFKTIKNLLKKIKNEDKK